MNNNGTHRAITGSIVALVTPFTQEGKLDEAALRRLVNFQIEGGTDIIIPCGTTGESPSLEADEQRRVIEVVVNEAKGRVRVMAGAGSNSTHHAVALSKAAEKAGAQGILSVGPYYNKPTAAGYIKHFSEVAAAVSLPIIVYNVPGRTGGNIAVDTLLKLANEVPNIVSVKEASANMNQIMELLRSRPAHLSVLSGDDPLTLAMMALGADGVISVAANEIPAVVKSLVTAMHQGKLDEARAIHNKYYGLFTMNFLESNPIPVKYILSRMGLCEATYRAPIVPGEPATLQKLDAEIEKLGLLKQFAAV
ncbi:MAG: 4-hydroxy-tetrahydrodipicolinate synthase [Chloroherpetonaceae bacterium]|nr:4-hydroxy-tetrahydrodipicolinate synthase [Chloroherpetonaceae bacterium]